MNITNYDELFRFFDEIIETRKIRRNSTFSYKDVSTEFQYIVKSFCEKSINSDSYFLRLSHSQLLTAVSLGYTSSAAVPRSEKSIFRQYDNSFYNIFDILCSYVGRLQFYVYNIITMCGVNVKRDLFANSPNLVIHYRSHIFIVHNFLCANPYSLLLTVLSPSFMFTQNEFDF